MIDLHCHMLPGIDDGSDSLDMSLNMAIEAKKEGVNKILLTPHHMDGEYVNHKKQVLSYVSKFKNELLKNNIDIEVRAGQEVHINGNLISAIENDDILYADKEGKYMMLELPHYGVPEYTENLIFELKVKGITPVIVHPERNHGFQEAPDKLYDLVEQGCLTQLTATSYLGGFGKKVQKFTEQIINSGLGFTFSSDAHNLEGRRFRMSQAYSRLEKKKGSLVVEKYKKNALDIWNSNSIDITEFRKISERPTFKSFFKIFKINR